MDHEVSRLCLMSGISHLAQMFSGWSAPTDVATHSSLMRRLDLAILASHPIHYQSLFRAIKAVTPCAFGAAHSGEPVAHRAPAQNNKAGAAFILRRGLRGSEDLVHDKPKAYLHVLWQSHRKRA